MRRHMRNVYVCSQYDFSSLAWDSQPITGSQPLWRHSCYVQHRWKSHLAWQATKEVNIEFAWNYADFNSNYYYFMRLMQLWKSPNYANTSLNYSSIGDGWIPVWTVSAAKFTWSKKRRNFAIGLSSEQLRHHIQIFISDEHWRFCLTPFLIKFKLRNTE